MARLIASLLALVALSDALLVQPRPLSSLPLRSPASSSLSFIRAETPPPPPPSGRLGATVDQDGKSNVWAVEPSMKVEGQDKGIMAFAPVVGVAALAVLCVPLLPLLFAANPDQA
uniref:Uncharacterized protein n=1 Tax=Coccolithus braarudii TaxID=221442 RepID=A0A7S0L765_9EUKA